MIDRPRSRRIIYGGRLPGVIYVGPKKSKTQELLDRMDRAWTRGAEDILADIQRENKQERKPKIGPPSSSSSSDDNIEISKIKIDPTGGGFSKTGGDLLDRAFSKIRSSFRVAAASRRAFKMAGGDPKSLRRGYFLSKAAKAEFGGDFLRRTRGTFSSAPDATQDPGLSKEQRFAEVLRRDLANRPQMMRQEELFDVDKYTDKTPLQAITDAAKKTADKILGLESGFVRIERNNTKTSEAFTKIKENLTEVKNVYVKTADNFKEFVDNKEQVIKIKEKIRDFKRKQSDKIEQDQKESQLELLKDTAGVSDVKETDQGLNQEQQDSGEGGGSILDLVGDALDFAEGRDLVRGGKRFRGARRRLFRMKWNKFRRGFGRRLGGLGRGLGRAGRGLGRLGRGFKGIGGRIFGPVLGDMIFPEGAGVSEPQMGPDGKFRTPEGRLVPEPGVARRSGKIAKVAETGEELLSKGGKILGRGKKVIGKVGTKIGAKIGSKLGGGLAKSIGKKIPGVGLILGGLASIDRFRSGDIIGGLGEIGSGVASLFPGVGTAISIGIDAALMGKDIAEAASQPEKKLSGGGIVAGEAGNEAVIPLSAAPAKKALKSMKGGGMGSAIGSVGPMLSAVAGIVRNPLYGAILGPTVNPILQPMLAKYKVPVYSADLGLFKASKLKSKATQAKGKSESIQKAGDNPMTSAFGWLGNLFGGIGGAVSGALGGIGNFFSRLFGGGRSGRGGGRGGGGGGMIPGPAPAEVKAFLDSVSYGEGGWDSVNPGTTVPGLSNMTIADARRAAMAKGYSMGGSGAMGKWQQMPEFILERARSAGLNPDKDKFSPENQTKIARMLAASVYPGGEAKLVEDLKRDPTSVIPHMRGTWPSLPGGSQQNTSMAEYRRNYDSALKKYGTQREEARVRQQNPQSRGLQGPPAPGTVGTGDGRQASAPTPSPASGAVASLPTQISPKSQTAPQPVAMSPALRDEQMYGSSTSNALVASRNTVVERNTTVIESSKKSGLGILDIQIMSLG